MSIFTIAWELVSQALLLIGSLALAYAIVVVVPLPRQHFFRDSRNNRVAALLLIALLIFWTLQLIRALKPEYP